MFKRLPFLHRVNAQFTQKSEEFCRKHILSLRREILAIDAAAPVSARRCDCLTIQVNCGFAVEQDFLLTYGEFLFHSPILSASP
jgi:hypothetical protein